MSGDRNIQGDRFKQGRYLQDWLYLSILLFLLPLSRKFSKFSKFQLRLKWKDKLNVAQNFETEQDIPTMAPFDYN